MKSWVIAGAALAVAAFIMSGCQESKNAKESPPGATCPVAAPGESGPTESCPVPAPGQGESALPALIEGTVVQALPAGRYVYLELDTGTGSVWVAAVEEPVDKGDKVSCRPMTRMVKFDSPVLKRTFDAVYFVAELTTPRSAAAMPTNHPPLHGGHMAMPAAGRGHGPALIKVEVAPAEGGVTVAAVAEQREKLAGSEVLLRGQVTKYNAAIMGVNWLHVQDGTDKRDLVVTTKVEANVGDVVLIRGKLERDVDLGSGYSYDLIIRNADVTVEKPARK